MGSLRRIGQYLGLVHADGAQPRRGGRRPSRYGGSAVSARLDEDLDDVRARLEAVERRLGLH